MIDIQTLRCEGSFREIMDCFLGQENILHIDLTNFIELDIPELDKVIFRCSQNHGLVLKQLAKCQAVDAFLMGIFLHLHKFATDEKPKMPIATPCDDVGLNCVPINIGSESYTGNVLFFRHKGNFLFYKSFIAFLQDPQTIDSSSCDLVGVVRVKLDVEDGRHRFQGAEGQRLF